VTARPADPVAAIEALRAIAADPEAFQARIQEVATEVAAESFTGSALDGGVVATVSGLGALRSIEIGTMAKRSTDNFTLGDAVVEAVRNAETNARNEMVRRTGVVLADSGLAGALDVDRLSRLSARRAE
jgi:DNA-binding protein YbaB